MPTGYNEIPGVYSESPRPLAAARRTLRNYRRCLTATGMVVMIILFSVLISVLVGNNNDTQDSAPTSSQPGSAAYQTMHSSGNEPMMSSKNNSVDTLLSISWPRRDEVWYKERWTPKRMRTPFLTPNVSTPSHNSETVLHPDRVKRSPDGSSAENDDRDHYVREEIPFTAEHRNIYDNEIENDKDKDFLNYFKDEKGDHNLTDDETDMYSDGDHESHGEEGDSMEEDGSTYPLGDSNNWNRDASMLPECSVKTIGEAMAESSRIQKDLDHLEDELERRNITLEVHSASFYHQKAFRRTSPRARHMARQGFRMDKASSIIANRLKVNKEDSTFDLQWLGDLSESPYCDYAQMRHICSKRDIYRSADGMCNNLKHPTWGASFTRFRRAMPPDYADGVLKPRQAEDGKPLPNPRVVSMNIHRYRRVSSQSYTLLTMVLGQFIDHDITATAQAKGKNGSSLSCCHEQVMNDSSLVHPECFEIPIPPEDTFFRTKNVTCMEFARSAPAPRCFLGPREQLNQNTHFLDGSVIYGSTQDDMNKLRQHKDGLLLTQVTTDGRQMLPPSLNPNDSCNTEQQMNWNQHCFVSGDSRVNEHIHLTIMHTLWVRQHNLIAEELRDINPHWDDEKLFQETRKIVIAQLQHIAYHEYLPSLLGPRLSYTLNLSPSFSGRYWKGYNPKIHPGIANGFAAGAFRFGHSMIQGLIQSVDSTGQNIQFEQLGKYFFQPFLIYDLTTIADMIRGQVSQKAAAVDTYFTTQVSQRLFKKKKDKHGLDLVAINIQRGRDHGIPGYIRWRMMCGLPLVQNFTDLKEDMDEGALQDIEKTYRSVDEIDLYTGGLAERPVEDGLVGPTFACIIADQFLRLKKGDRFWYENGPGPEAFTRDQLLELRKTSLAMILCNTVIEMGSLQRWPLRKFEADNPRLACTSGLIPRISLEPWEEKAFD